MLNLLDNHLPSSGDHPLEDSVELTDFPDLEFSIGTRAVEMLRLRKKINLQLPFVFQGYSSCYNHTQRYDVSSDEVDVITEAKIEGSSKTSVETTKCQSVLCLPIVELPTIPDNYNLNRLRQPGKTLQEELSVLREIGYLKIKATKELQNFHSQDSRKSIDNLFEISSSNSQIINKSKTGFLFYSFGKTDHLHLKLIELKHFDFSNLLAAFNIPDKHKTYISVENLSWEATGAFDAVNVFLLNLDLTTLDIQSLNIRVSIKRYFGECCADELGFIALALIERYKRNLKVSNLTQAVSIALKARELAIDKAPLSSQMALLRCRFYIDKQSKTDFFPETFFAVRNELNDDMHILAVDSLLTELLLEYGIADTSESIDSCLNRARVLIGFCSNGDNIENMKSIQLSILKNKHFQ